MAIPAPADKPQGIGLGQFPAVAHATPAEDAVFIPEGIANFLDPAAHGDVLNGPGIGGLGHEQLGDIAPQAAHFFRIGLDDHALLHAQGAGRGDFGFSVLDLFHNAESAGADILKKGHMAEMGDADTVFDGGIEDAAAFGRLDRSNRQ